MAEPQFKRDFRIQVQDFETAKLDVQFRVSRTLTPDANTCDIKIWNLAESTRDSLSDAESIFVKVEAGYNQSRGEIFRTRVRDIMSTQDGANWMTVIEGGDGERTLKEARVGNPEATGDDANKGRRYRRGTLISAVLRDLANDLTTGVDEIGPGNALPFLDAAQFTETASAEFQKGTVITGSSAKEFTDLLKSCGLEWSIQDGELQVLKIGEGLPVESAVPDLTSQTGLIGTPTVSSDGVLTATALMNSDISPGRSMFVSTRRVPRTLYRIETADYVGDIQNNGKDWYVHFEARPV